MPAGRLLIRAGVLVSALFAPFALQAPLAQSVPSAAAGHARVIVKYREGSAMTQALALSPAAQHTMRAQALGRRIGMQLESGRGLSERSQVVLARGMTSAQLAARIGAERDVEYAVVDERKYIVAVPNDPLYNTRAIAGTSGGPDVGQWYLKPPGPAGTAARTAPAAINAEQAWDLTTGSASIVVAVLDTGLRFDHPDLQGGNVLPGYDMISADNGSTNTDFRTANDGNGRDADASDPGDFVTSAEANDSNSPLHQCRVESSSWHGTQTLGLIGATTQNGIGVAGLGRSVRVMPIRVLGKCGGYDSDILAGMRWAAGLSVPGLPANPTPARVVNLSLGGTGSCSAAYASETANLNAVGVVVVASAGNSAGHAVGTPANCAGVIAVAGIRHIGTKVGFSDLGPQIAISAPGGNCVNIGSNEPCLYPMVTTTNAGTSTPVAGGIYSDAFTASLGTSFASPLVAGAAALMLSAQPGLTPAEVKSKLQSTARPFPTATVDEGGATVPVCMAPTSADQLQCVCTTGLCGAGMLDVRAAILATVSVQARITVDTPTPTAGAPVVLSSGSLVGSGRSIATYQWTLVDGGGIVTAFSGAANASTVSLLPASVGTFRVSLTTTDDLGVASTATLSVGVAALPAENPMPADSGGSGGGGGGGGALGAEWLLLLLGACLTLLAADRAERRQTPRLSAAASGPDRG
jgi:serine protease